VLRRTLGPKGVGSNRTNEKIIRAELHNLYKSPVIVGKFKIKQSEMVKLCSTHR
jgi:hypothetical protein